MKVRAFSVGTIYFNEIACGTIFSENGEFFVKTNEVVYKDDKLKRYVINAVNIENGSLTSFPPLHKVFPFKDAELVVK